MLFWSLCLLYNSIIKTSLSGLLAMSSASLTFSMSDACHILQLIVMWPRNFSRCLLIVSISFLVVTILLEISSLFSQFIYGILGTQQQNHILIASGVFFICEEIHCYIRNDILQSSSVLFSLLLKTFSYLFYVAQFLKGIIRFYQVKS